MDNTQPDEDTCTAAQLWCLPKHQHKVMDPDLCHDIIAAIRAARKDERANTIKECIEAIESTAKFSDAIEHMPRADDFITALKKLGE